MTSAQNALDLPAMVRQRDYRRFLVIQLAPRTQRPALYALTAFANEMAHIPHHVNEPLAGFMRYAWWREALEAMRDGQPARAHPLLQELEPWLMAHPGGYAHLLAIIETGQHLIENHDDMAQHTRREAELDAVWRMELGSSSPRLMEVLRSLPLGEPLGVRAILRVLWAGLKA